MRQTSTILLGKRFCQDMNNSMTGRSQDGIERKLQKGTRVRIIFMAFGVFLVVEYS